MKRRNTVAIAAVVVALLALAAAIYFLRPGSSPQPTTAQAPEAGESSAPAATTPPAEEEKAADTSAPADEAEEKAAEESAAAEEKAADTPATAEETEEKSADAPTPTEDKAEDAGAPAGQKAEDAPAPTEEKKTADAAKPESEAEDKPSFDVVRIEPTGEGVIAGRAAPGWKVIIESRGVKVAEAAADDQGEWTVVFDRPLSPGTHDLSVKATSPDGSKEFISTQSVSADVATLPTKKASLPEPETARMSDAAPPATVESASPPVTSGRASPGSAPPLPQTAAIQEGKATPPSSLPQQTKPGSYTILPGDTLWDIATRYLGAGWRYKQIYRDNRKIVRNPNLIYPEQKMTIAEPPSEAN